MPDAHLGRGCTVGSVIALKGAVSPASVGVDIGCGMASLQTSLTASDLPDDLGKLRHQFERTIPVGRFGHKDPAPEGADWEGWEQFQNLHPAVQKLQDRAKCQLGSLGGGNHFIELCLDENDQVWLMLHSGSRNIGKSLADIHINIAKKLSHNEDLPDPDLAVLLQNTPQMRDYRRDLFWAQNYAWKNRQVMVQLLWRQLQRAFPNMNRSPEESVYCHHNYVEEMRIADEEVLVTRKGAISARKDQMGIIPGSMGTKSYIVQGLGSEESMFSASHGAGRRMSRGEARRTFTMKDLEHQTAGVECRKDIKIVDEIPLAYKPIDEVMEAQKDLVEIRHTLKAVLCVKGG